MYYNLSMQINGEMRESVINRLRRVEGQVRGIQRLVEEGANCKKVASQVKAAHTALGAVGKLILACYLAESMKGDPLAEKDAIEMLVKF